MKLQDDHPQSYGEVSKVVIPMLPSTDIQMTSNNETRRQTNSGLPSIVDRYFSKPVLDPTNKAACKRASDKRSDNFQNDNEYHVKNIEAKNTQKPKNVQKYKKTEKDNGADDESLNKVSVEKKTEGYCTCISEKKHVVTIEP